SPEYIEIAGVRIPLHRLLHQQRQAVHSSAHVGMPDRQPYAHPARNRDHRRDSTFITRANAVASTSAPTMIRSPPASTLSIRPVAAGASAATPGPDVIVAGTNATASPAASGRPVPICRRHVKSMLVLRS